MPKKTNTKSEESVNVETVNVETTDKKVKKSRSLEKNVQEPITTTTNATETPVEDKKDRKIKSSKKSEKKEEPVIEVVQPVEEKKARKSKKASTDVVVQEVVQEVVVETSESTEPEGRRKRRQVTRDSVDSDFSSLEEQLVSIINDLNDKKAINVRLVKKLHKSLTTLHSDCLKVCKVKNATKRASNPESGFMKPVKISNELSNFTGWNPEQLRSRVEVTKYICDYIRQKELQNPSDRRQFQPDEKLSKLLGQDEKKGGTVTYPGLQQRLQTHFTKV
jgi:chromatin remodeling complex protein RSC6